MPLTAIHRSPMQRRFSFCMIMVRREIHRQACLRVGSGRCFKLVIDIRRSNLRNLMPFVGGHNGGRTLAFVSRFLVNQRNFSI